MIAVTNIHDLRRARFLKGNKNKISIKNNKVERAEKINTINRCMQKCKQSKIHFKIQFHKFINIFILKIFFDIEDCSSGVNKAGCDMS